MCSYIKLDLFPKGFHSHFGDQRFHLNHKSKIVHQNIQFRFV